MQFITIDSIDDERVAAYTNLTEIQLRNRLEPERGLFIAADLSKSEAARSMYEEIGSGLVTRMSWAFRVEKDAYDRATRTRTVLKIAKVYDVSAVSVPANPATEISARSYFDGVIERERQEQLAAEAAARRKQRLKVYLEVIRK